MVPPRYDLERGPDEPRIDGDEIDPRRCGDRVVFSVRVAVGVVVVAIGPEVDANDVRLGGLSAPV